MTTRQDLQYVGEVLALAVEAESDKSRLAHGVSLRQQMYDTTATGLPFNHYRSQWLAKSIHATIDFAKGLCREFDAAHPDDRASTLDLSDILRGAYNLVTQQVKGRG